MDIRQLLGLPELLEVRSLVCVQPHPDDNEVGAGGTLLTLAQRGCRIVFVTVTDGRWGAEDPTVSAQDLIAVRRGERDAAGQMIGVAVQLELGFEDGGDYEERSVMEALIPILRKEKPELVMTVDPWMPYESHPDHQKTGRAVAAAVLAAGHIQFPEAGAPYGVPQVAFYGSSYPNTWVDVTATWETKMAAIFAHKSQFDNTEWPLLSQYFADQAAVAFRNHAPMPGVVSSGYAEAFKVLSRRQLHFFPSAVYL
ncbi:PIG-L family deacetylase [Alicyclobacillaceae bacterium I2511]|nr:PIG-L family deacetylase [Alicyclobacillaceae bacterium I2511]